MHKSSVLLLCYLLWHAAHSQSTSPIMGSHAYAMANASVCLTDEWSVFNNSAGLASNKESQASVSCLARRGLNGGNTVAAIAIVPINFGTIGIGTSKFGDDLYSESIACLGFGHKIGITSIGIRISYNQFNAEGFGTKGVVSTSAGVITQLTPAFSVGALILNINQPAISTSEGQKLASVFIAGVGLKASESVFLTSEADKKIDEPLIVRFGFEYKFREKFFIRTGFSSNPDSGYGGIGFKATKLALNYAYRYDFNLGSSHQATLTLKLKKAR